MVTKMFSATRKQYNEKPRNNCAVCQCSNLEALAVEEDASQQDQDHATGAMTGSDESDFADDSDPGFVVGDGESGGKKKAKKKRKKKPLVQLPETICTANERFACNGPHMVHEECLNELEAEIAAGNATGCPECEAILSRLQMGNPSANMKLKSECGRYELTPSTKMLHFRDWLQSVPKDDKVLVFSTFKGILDLLESLLGQMKVPVLRYDGDDPYKGVQLRRFQQETAKESRVLLSTVASGGVGLNITVANHVYFIDRWYNPTVTDQATDRAHRIGQTKAVTVTYTDIENTLDTVLKALVEMKSANASVVLEDGTELASSQNKWADIRGILFSGLQEAREKRTTTDTAAAEQDGSGGGAGRNGVPPPAAAAASAVSTEMEQLLAMGFENTAQTWQALEAAQGDVGRALDFLMGGP